MLNQYLIKTLFLVQFVQITIASSGDKSQHFVRCLQKCHQNNCHRDGSFKKEPSFDLQLLQWSCQDDCKYDCMWQTVDFFTAHGLSVPQFHGKWPFIRIFGLQEPASVLFSLLNFVSHLRMYLKFKKTANRRTPMFYVWTYFTFICLCGWFWSTVFHARDNDFTEAMDYSFAFTTVLTLFYCLLMRMAYTQFMNFKVSAVITCGYLSILYTHISHLWSGRINYDYNMKFNIVIGVLTFALTMYWWYLNSRKLLHCHHIGWFTILTVAVTLLEIADFPPILWTFDAHSLWHASTVPLVKYLYRFIIEDCAYLTNYFMKLDNYMQ